MRKQYNNQNPKEMILLMVFVFALLLALILVDMFFEPAILSLIV
jgi:hypothetical protein